MPKEIKITRSEIGTECRMARKVPATALKDCFVTFNVCVDECCHEWKPHLLRAFLGLFFIVQCSFLSISQEKSLLFQLVVKKLINEMPCLSQNMVHVTFRSVRNSLDLTYPGNKVSPFHRLPFRFTCIISNPSFIPLVYLVWKFLAILILQSSVHLPQQYHYLKW